MKPGDILRLKDGTLGLEGEDLYAIYLDRTKQGKQYLVVCHTVQGRKELGRDNIARVAAKSRVDDASSMSDGELTARLEQVRADLNQLSPKERGGRRKGLDDIDDRRVWELVVNEVDTCTPEEAAAIIFEDATGDKIGDVRAAMQACQTKGVGYFERAEGRGERYRPYAVEEIKSVRREIEGMRKLRNELIRIREIEDPETGEVDQLIEGVPIDEVELDEDDQERLELLSGFIQDFVLHDEDRGAVGLAGTPIHTLDGFVLGRFARFLAFDWLGGKGTSISGAYVEFLIRARLLDVREANLLVAQRHVLLSEHMKWDYPERCLKAADRLPEEIPEAWFEGRQDLRELETYTIDPPDAKDFDDAISLVQDGDDQLLYVHIADVAQYVETGTAIDFEARSRGTSTYLPTGVLPMLPPRLADDLCSLKAEVDRPAMTAILRIGPDGEVKDAEICESIIQVDENLAYDDALEGIEAGQEPFVSLDALASKMAGTRGGLELETDELKVHIDSDKVDPHLKSGSRATKLIEQFMVAANEAVARFLTEKELPTPYRCHPLPDRSSVETFNKRMEVMELDLSLELPVLDDEEEDGEGAQDDEAEDDFLAALQGGKVELVGGGFVSSKEEDEAEEPEGDEEGEDSSTSVGTPKLDGLAQLDEEDRRAYLEPFTELLQQVARIEDKPLRNLVQLKLLGCMGRALYTPSNIGHFGLGSTCYLHFTSPIRRYPDLVVHRQLKAILRDQDEPAHDADELATLCPKNTDQSVEAEQLERDLIAVALAFQARTEGWGGAHTAMVNGITKGGVFLSLKDGVEARLATSDIPGGPWDVDDSGARLFKGERTLDTTDEEILERVMESDWREVYDEEMDETIHVRLRLGDKVKVRIDTIDLAMGKISVRLALAGDDDAS